jgi:cytochrome c
VRACLAIVALSLLSIAPSAPAADKQRGAELYSSRCGACHSIETNGAGPRHKGLFGRKAGTQAGFAYSRALRDSGLVWTDERIDRWLANPSALVPGNIMVVQLANAPVDRADLIAYLKQATK